MPIKSLLRSIQTEGLWENYTSAKQNFRPHKTRNYYGYKSWNYHYTRSAAEDVSM